MDFRCSFRWMMSIHPDAEIAKPELMDKRPQAEHVMRDMAVAYDSEDKGPC